MITAVAIYPGNDGSFSTALPTTITSAPALQLRQAFFRIDERLTLHTIIRSI